MAVTATVDIRNRAQAAKPALGRKRTRRTTRQAGQALEKLGHAIEYLTDEYVHKITDPAPDDSEIAAIQILMGLNRQIYFECPVATPFGERIRAWLRSVNS